MMVKMVLLRSSFTFVNERMFQLWTNWLSPGSVRRVQSGGARGRSVSTLTKYLYNTIYALYCGMNWVKRQWGGSMKSPQPQWLMNSFSNWTWSSCLPRISRLTSLSLSAVLSSPSEMYIYSIVPDTAWLTGPITCHCSILLFSSITLPRKRICVECENFDLLLFRGSSVRSAVAVDLRP